MFHCISHTQRLLVTVPVWKLPTNIHKLDNSYVPFVILTLNRQLVSIQVQV